MRSCDVECSRNYQMDNIKALLLFLVAFGHTLDVYKDSGGAELYIMKYIYLFHMPMFAFVTGYFTKNVDKARNTAIEKCLIPYLVFQGIYVLVASLMINLGVANFNSDLFNGSIVAPSSAFYYLLAVFVWKLLAKDFMRIRHPLLLSVVLGLSISITKMDDFMVGYGAVLSLLPFFVLGVLCTKDKIKKINNMPKIVAILILVIGVVPSYYLPFNICAVRKSYSDAGFNSIQGILYRLIFYVIAVMMGMAIICLMSEKETWVSHIGKASILVYAGSTFLAPHAYVLLDKLLPLSDNRVVNMIGMIVFCMAVVLICSIPVFLKWYNTVIETINRLIFRKAVKDDV